jgi:hypothetical protein
VPEPNISACWIGSICPVLHREFRQRSIERIGRSIGAFQFAVEIPESHRLRASSTAAASSEPLDARAQVGERCFPGTYPRRAYHGHHSLSLLLCHGLPSSPTAKDGQRLYSKRKCATYFSSVANCEPGRSSSAIISGVCQHSSTAGRAAILRGNVCRSTNSVRTRCRASPVTVTHLAPATCTA